MSAADFIERMRDRQAELYSTTVNVSRFYSEGTFDPDTASYTTPAYITVYTGAALLRPDSDSMAAVGETTTELSSYTLKLPANTAIEVGDTVAVTASDFDDGLVGVGLRVMDVTNDEWQIARRCRCVQQTPRPT